MESPKLRIAGISEKPLPKRLQLTEAILPALACPAGKRRVRIYDTKVPGLAYAITAGGARAWYWYGRVKGLPNPVDFHLGDADAVPLVDARRMAIAVASKAAEGIDPRAERREAKAKQKEAVTLEQLWTWYRDDHLLPNGSPNTIRTDVSRWNRHLSAWKHRDISSITREEVREFHKHLTKPKTPNTADKTVKMLRRLLTYGEVDPNPAGARAVRFHG